MPAAASEPARLTLIHGGSYAEREAYLAAAIGDLPAGQACAAILEGFPSGTALLEESARLQLQRIAPGCFCCSGSLTLRVTLNRILRRRPAHIYLSLASDAHLAQLCATLGQPPYSGLFLAVSCVCI